MKQIRSYQDHHRYKFMIFSLQRAALDTVKTMETVGKLKRKKKNKAHRPTMRPHEFWGISSYLSTVIATLGGRYATVLF